MTVLEIGRLLRAGTRGFVVGCRVSQLETPAFGALVQVPIREGYQVYGLISDIHIDDDGVVRQLVTADNVEQAVIADNRLNRNIPIEMSVLAVGYQEGGAIYHLLPPRPPLSLDVIYLCSQVDVVRFTGGGRFGYFRHILRATDVPVGELVAAHLAQANAAHSASGKNSWGDEAVREIIALLRDDYATLMSVLSSVGEVLGKKP